MIAYLFRPAGLEASTRRLVAWTELVGKPG